MKWLLLLVFLISTLSIYFQEKCCTLSKRPSMILSITKLLDRVVYFLYRDWTECNTLNTNFLNREREGRGQDTEKESVCHITCPWAEQPLLLPLFRRPRMVWQEDEQEQAYHVILFCICVCVFHLFIIFHCRALTQNLLLGLDATHSHTHCTTLLVLSLYSQRWLIH